MAYAFAFTGSALLPEVYQLADGALAERRCNSRKGCWGYLVSGAGRATAFYTDKQWARKEAAR